MSKRFQDNTLSSESEKRRYIRLSMGEGDYMEETPEDYFEDDDELDDFYDDSDYMDDEDEIACEDRKNEFYQNICFYSLLFVFGLSIVGIVALLWRIIVYPIISITAKKLDW